MYGFPRMYGGFLFEVNMPYKITNQDEKYQVVDDTGKIMNEHETRAKALAQMRALYVHVPDAKSGRRNSASDADKLRQMQAIINDLLSGEMTEETDEMTGLPGDSMEQLQERLADLPTKSLNLSYAKSLGIDLPDLAVKSTGADEIRGYVALWGNPALTDVEAEYFTPDTNFWDSNLKSSGYMPPLTWDHAQDTSFKADPRIGAIVETGDDDIGRWYIAKLERGHKYRKAIDRLISDGKLGTSSDSAPQYVERVKTGKSTWLKTWPLFAAALTDTPAEPRMIGTLEYYKSLGAILPDSSGLNWQWMTSRIKRLSIQ